MTQVCTTQSPKAHILTHYSDIEPFQAVSEQKTKNTFVYWRAEFCTIESNCQISKGAKIIIRIWKNLDQLNALKWNCHIFIWMERNDKTNLSLNRVPSISRLHLSWAFITLSSLQWYDVCDSSDRHWWVPGRNFRLRTLLRQHPGNIRMLLSTRLPLGSRPALLYLWVTFGL